MAVGSFSAGLSGLNANSTYLSVIGNNLANINTIGYKSSSVTFQDLVSQTVGGSNGNPMQVGLGVATGSISPSFSQGAIENTREATNVAIQGNGFFVVRGSNGNVYTRAGNFTLNSNGKLVTPDGYFVQGYTQINSATGGIVNTGQPTDITVAAGALRASSPTTTFRTVTNLSAAAELDDTFTTSVQVTDSLGAQHVATISYTKSATVGEWAYTVSLAAQDMGTAADVDVATGTVAFDASGALATVNGGVPADVTISTGAAWGNGAAASTWTWDLVDNNAVASLTGFAAPSATSSVSADGSTAGTIDSVSVAPDGSIIATLGTGQTMAVAQLALASFNNPRGLSKLGANKFGETQMAGVANVGIAGVGGRGNLIGSALEQSNVDIAQEFTQMILAQRGYQANSKVITVSDEMLVDTLALKR